MSSVGYFIDEHFALGYAVVLCVARTSVAFILRHDGPVRLMLHRPIRSQYYMFTFLRELHSLLLFFLLLTADLYRVIGSVSHADVRYAGTSQAILRVNVTHAVVDLLFLLQVDVLVLGLEDDLATLRWTKLLLLKLI